MADLTPRDDIKKSVSEILKRVDQLLKSGSLDEAQKQIARAKEIDPKNVYVFAYEERLNSMIEEKKAAEEIQAKRRAEEEVEKQREEEKHKAEEEKRKAAEEIHRKEEEEQRRKEKERREAEESARREKEEQRKHAEEARLREEEKRRSADEERRQGEAARKKIDERRKQWGEVQKTAPGTEGQGKSPVPQVSREVLEETKKKILDDRKKKGLKPHDPAPGSSFHTAYEEGLDIYRRVLFEAWADGATTPDEQAQLSSLCASLTISKEDQTRLQREAKLESYTIAFRRAWSSGAISPESASSLAELRRKFQINMEDHEQIETTLLWELRSSSQKAQILIVDDDAKLLAVIADTLQDAGFQTITMTTSDEAFTLLKTVTPDLIISDINLETSTMGGFSFYEKVREVERLQDIPFIFLSGLTDEVLIRTGKELGVDDYMTKPFSNDNLIATIKGKLKRYRQMKKNRR